MIPTRPPWLTATFVSLWVLSGYATWRAAPQIDAALNPILTDVHYVPFDPEHYGSAVAVRQLDRVCFRFHIHKNRAAASRFWALTIVFPDGTRSYTNPIDGRTGRDFTTKDTYDQGFDGNIVICADLSGIADGLDPSGPFTIESYSSYEPTHRLWRIPVTLPPLAVPAAVPGGDQ